MGSGYFGEMNNRIEKRRSGSPATAGTTGRRGRKGGGGSGGEKPKQPQRGLGVAQLEKIRLHGEMGCSSYSHFYPNLSAGDDMRMQTTASFSYSSIQSSSSSPNSYNFHQSFMGMGEYERGSFRYGDSQPTTTSSLRWDPSNTFLETQHFGQPNMSGHLFNPHVQDSIDHKNTMNAKYGSDSMGSSSQNSESSETQELDLELRLSI